MEIRTYRIQPRETIQPERPSMAVAWAMAASMAGVMFAMLITVGLIVRAFGG